MIVLIFLPSCTLWLPDAVSNVAKDLSTKVTTDGGPASIPRDVWRTERSTRIPTNYDALELVPLPQNTGIEQQTESDGNPANLWVVKRDITQSTAQEIAEHESKGIDKANEDKISSASNNIREAEARQDKEDKEVFGSFKRP